MLLACAMSRLDRGFEVASIQAKAPRYAIVCNQAEASISRHVTVLRSEVALPGSPDPPRNGGNARTVFFYELFPLQLKNLHVTLRFVNGSKVDPPTGFRPLCRRVAKPFRPADRGA